MSGEAHIRIDEGIARGPKPKKQRIALQRPKQAQTENASESTQLSPIIPANLDPNEVLQRYLAERHTSGIAESYGVTRRNLVRWLREVAPEQWKQVQIVRAITFHEDGQEGLESAEDALALARAREIVKSGQWTLERLDSENYGPKQEVKHSGSITFSHALQAISARRLTGDGGNGAAQLTQSIIDVSPDEPK